MNRKTYLIIGAIIVLIIIIFLYYKNKENKTPVIVTGTTPQTSSPSTSAGLTGMLFNGNFSAISSFF